MNETVRRAILCALGLGLLSACVTEGDRGGLRQEVSDTGPPDLDTVADAASDAELSDGASDAEPPDDVRPDAPDDTAEITPAETDGGDDVTLCEPASPPVERCNGRDDDCNGVTDEPPLSPGCGDYACLGEDGCATACTDNAQCAPGLACDLADHDGDLRTDECLATGEDGTACVLGAQCRSGYCANGRCCRDDGSGPTCCAEDRDCAALDGAAICTEKSAAGCLGVAAVGRCQDAICVAVQVPSPEGCLGQVCRGGQCLAEGRFDAPHLCDSEGACLETEDLICDDGDACTFDGCDAASGCVVTPRSGETELPCYTFAPETRGIGACEDGVVTCQNGVAQGCSGDRGPQDEVCNGADDDCDGRTDEDTEVACFPYLCGGEGGCLQSCEESTDCAAGNFCDTGVCAGTGDDGAICGDDDQCKSGHCSGGVCCEAGLCCRADQDCASLDDAICEEAAGMCGGVRIEGVCGEGARCTTISVADATVCTGEICAAARCSGALLEPEGICEAAECLRGPTRSCSPYACVAGACLNACDGDEDCSGGAVCRQGQCVSLPDGAVCGAAAECRSGHCENGFCCAAPGLCCGGDDADCAALDRPGVCTDDDACQGSRVVGTCGEDFRCTTETISDPAACVGRACGESECVNLVTGGLVDPNGIRTPTCDSTGTCTPVVRDCREAGSAQCTSNSGFAFSCDNCSPNRTTCVVFASPCYCE